MSIKDALVMLSLEEFLTAWINPRHTKVITVILPPALIKGRGIPVAGIVPVFVPMFIKSSRRILKPIPTVSIEKKILSKYFMDTRNITTIKNPYIPKRITEPTRPNSSAKEANMKSVWCSGRKFLLL